MDRGTYFSVNRVASLAVLGVFILPSVASARPDRAPSVELVARALNVDISSSAPLDEHGHETAHAVGSRLVSLCPDCRLATIDEEGPCGWARVNRLIIKNAVAKGMGEEEIVKTYVATYGAQVLAIDKGTGLAAFSWIVPMAVTVVSFAGLLVLGRRMTQREPVPVPVAATSARGEGNDEARALLKAELDELD